MSNHMGGEMLNEVLKLLKEKEYDFYEKIGKEKTLSFIKAIVEIGDYYDCNDDEILEDIATTLGICYLCLAPKSNIKFDMCVDCRK